MIIILLKNISNNAMVAQEASGEGNAMNTDRNKVMELNAAVGRFVRDGCHISIGGFTINRNPMAAVYEIIRQKRKRLYVYAHSNGQGLDELIGAGCVEKLEIAYGGNGRFAPTCIRFRKAVEQGTLLVEDYTNYQMTLRFLAGAMGIPFLPTRSSLGTSIVDTWGFPEEMRRSDPKMPDSKLIVAENPFDSWADAPKLVLVPAINPDVTIIHVQKADRQGTVAIAGLTFADVEQAKSAKHVIVTCEELVEERELRKNPDHNQLPFFYVDAVAHVPFGAYPTACYRYYDYDPKYLNDYRKFAQDDALFENYMNRFVFGIKDHADLIRKIGLGNDHPIMADSDTGYAVGLDRR
jgi:glutaconate CoA-transferase, subunit A